MKKFLLFYLNLILLLPLHGYEYDVAICSMFQNEARFLGEWIEYHKKVGVQHFWLYNNNSTDNYREELAPYIISGLVELIEWPSVHNGNDFRNHTFTTQVSAFTDALNKARKKSRWLAAIDTDEFIVPVSAKTIPKVLDAHFSGQAGVYVNWVMYGTSGIELCEKGHMIDTLLLRSNFEFTMNTERKSIVRTKTADKYTNPHFALLKSGHYVDGAGKPTHPLVRDGVFIEHLRINHYWCRDRRFMETVKIPRYEKWGGKAEFVHILEVQMNEVYDPIILNYL